MEKCSGVHRAEGSISDIHGKAEPRDLGISGAGLPEMFEDHQNLRVFFLIFWSVEGAKRNGLKCAINPVQGVREIRGKLDSYPPHSKLAFSRNFLLFPCVALVLGRILGGLSRNHEIMESWNGLVWNGFGGHLVPAIPGSVQGQIGTIWDCKIPAHGLG